MTDNDPDLIKALGALIEPMTRGDPQSPLRWTCKSTYRLAEQLTQQDHPIGPRTVAKLLQDSGYSLQANRKTREGKQHPDRKCLGKTGKKAKKPPGTKGWLFCLISRGAAYFWQQPAFWQGPQPPFWQQPAPPFWQAPWPPFWQHPPLPQQLGQQGSQHCLLLRAHNQPCRFMLRPPQQPPFWQHPWPAFWQHPAPAPFWQQPAPPFFWQQPLPAFWQQPAALAPQPAF